MKVRTNEDYFIHPHSIFITLILGGISACFLGLSVSFIYSRVQGQIPPVSLPSLFYFNSLLLMASSYFLIKAKRAYKSDSIAPFKQALLITLILTILFLFLQIIAWWQLFYGSVPVDHSTTASYLYVISGLHFVHVIAGIPFLATFLYTANKNLSEPVSVLIYFSDIDKRRRLNLLTIYWHFLDALWIYLVIFFAINYWIS